MRQIAREFMCFGRWEMRGDWLQSKLPMIAQGKQKGHNAQVFLSTIAAASAGNRRRKCSLFDGADFRDGGI
jgi:hypothetical protein